MNPCMALRLTHFSAALGDSRIDTRTATEQFQQDKSSAAGLPYFGIQKGLPQTLDDDSTLRGQDTERCA